MHKDLCYGVSGLCDAMRPTKGSDLLKYLRKVNFTGKYYKLRLSYECAIIVQLNCYELPYAAFSIQTKALSFVYLFCFQGLSGDRFHFNNNGDGPARYNIIHFKQTETGKYKWVKVGEYDEGELRLNMSGNVTLFFSFLFPLFLRARFFLQLVSCVLCKR